MALVYGASGISPSLRGQPSFKYTLLAGETMIIPPGTFGVRPGIYSTVQQYNPITTCWENCGDTGTRDYFYVQSDGVNFRVANQSGCVVGAIVTTAGSAYTSVPTITTSTGGAVAKAIVGGAISTTVTVTKGGANYVYPPLVQIAAPPSVGLPATATAALTSGAVSSITVTNQGAGYLVAPAVTLLNDPRDTAGSGATATSALTGSGTVTAVVITDHGSAVTSVPTFTFSSGSAAATAICAFAITSYGVTTAGAAYSAAAGNVMVQFTPIATAGSSVLTNPDYQTGLVRMRPCQIAAVTSGAGAITTTQQVIDGGCYEAIPSIHNAGIAASSGIVTTAATLAVNVGGISDQCLMIPC